MYCSNHDHYVLQNKEVYYQSYRKQYDAKTIEKFFTNWLELKNTTNSKCPRYVDECMVEMNRLRTKTIEELDGLFMSELNKTLQYSIDDFLD
jgi:hypothetical protein